MRYVPVRQSATLPAQTMRPNLCRNEECCSGCYLRRPHSRHRKGRVHLQFGAEAVNRTGGVAFVTVVHECDMAAPYAAYTRAQIERGLFRTQLDGDLRRWFVVSETRLLPCHRSGYRWLYSFSPAYEMHIDRPHISNFCHLVSLLPLRR